MYNENNDNNNQCQRFPGKTFSRDFNKWFSKVNLLLWKKGCTTNNHSTHCKARQVLRDLFNTNQVNGSEITFVAGITKINLKKLKT